MGDIFFFIKVLILTCVFTIFMQIKIGETTLEQKAEVYIKESYAGQTLLEVAQGGVAVLADLYRNLSKSISSNVTKDLKQESIPGQRSFGIKLERSKEFLREKVKEGKDAAESRAKKAIKTLKENPEVVREKVEAAKEFAKEQYESLEE